MEPTPLEKKALPCFILCFLFGYLGLHRFYVGKYGTGFLQLISAGGFGIWVMIDLFLLLFNKFTDKQGRIVRW